MDSRLSIIVAYNIGYVNIVFTFTTLRFTARLCRILHHLGPAFMERASTLEWTRLWGSKVVRLSACLIRYSPRKYRPTTRCAEIPSATLPSFLPTDT